MKVKECEKCVFCKRYVYSSTYKPVGYHAIGMSHAYRYCIKHNMRCLDVKKCEESKSGDRMDKEVKENE